MPEVRSCPDLELILTQQQKEQTKDGDYEYLNYHHFQAVPYDRFMSWKAGSGSIAWGLGTTVREGVNEPREDKILPKENGVIVMETNFKLVRRG